MKTTHQITITLQDQQDKKHLQLALLDTLQTISTAIEDNPSKNPHQLTESCYWISEIIKQTIIQE